jgi:hypothetical protein
MWVMTLIAKNYLKEGKMQNEEPRRRADGVSSLDKKFIIPAGIIPTEPKCCFPEPPQSDGVCTSTSNQSKGAKNEKDNVF